MTYINLENKQQTLTFYTTQAAYMLPTLQIHFERFMTVYVSNNQKTLDDLTLRKKDLALAKIAILGTHQVLKNQER